MDQTTLPDNTITITPDPLRDLTPPAEAPPTVKQVIDQTSTTTSPSPRLAKQAWVLFIILLLVAFFVALYFTISASTRLNS